MTTDPGWDLGWLMLGLTVGAIGYASLQAGVGMLWRRIRRGTAGHHGPAAARS